MQHVAWFDSPWLPRHGPVTASATILPHFARPMPPLHSARRLALHSARSLTASIPTAGLILSVALTASVASAQTYPVGGRPSPRFGAQPFTQQLLLTEEFGTRPLPPGGQVPADSVGHINAAVTLDGCPSDTC
ncbi:MAG: hypothetical protein ACK55I_47780, partial [bacterium]